MFSVAQVKVHRTESHHERFNSARALFERIGSGDNLLEETSRGTSRWTDRLTLIWSKKALKMTKKSHKMAKKTAKTSKTSLLFLILPVLLLSAQSLPGPALTFCNQLLSSANPFFVV